MKRNGHLLMRLIASALLLAAGRGTSSPPRDGGDKPLAAYRTLLVESFTVDSRAARKNYPGGYESWLQNETLTRLQTERVFEEVADACDREPAGEEGPRLTLSGAVMAYDKGNRMVRLLTGLGPGAGKVKVRFVFRDAVSGREVFRTVRQGKFYGWSDLRGSEQHAMTEAGGDVIDRLIQDVRRNGGLSKRSPAPPPPPLFMGADLVFLPELLGTWTRDGSDSALAVEKGRGLAYTVRVEGEKMFALPLHAGYLGPRLFFEVFLANLPGPSFYGKAELEGEVLRLSFLDAAWLKERRTRGISTQELQALVIEHADDCQAFVEPVTFHRRQ